MTTLPRSIVTTAPIAGMDVPAPAIKKAITTDSATPLFNIAISSGMLDVHVTYNGSPINAAKTTESGPCPKNVETISPVTIA